MKYPFLKTHNEIRNNFKLLHSLFLFKGHRGNKDKLLITGAELSRMKLRGLSFYRDNINCWQLMAEL